MQVSSFRGSKATGTATFFTGLSRLAPTSIHPSLSLPPHRVPPDHDRNREHEVEKLGAQESVGGTGPRPPSPKPSHAIKRATRARDHGHRRKVARILTRVGTFLGVQGADWVEPNLWHGRAAEFPMIPGEEYRNEVLTRIDQRYGYPTTPGEDIRIKVRTGADHIERNTMTPRSRAGSASSVRIT